MSSTAQHHQRKQESKQQPEAETKAHREGRSQGQGERQGERQSERRSETRDSVFDVSVLSTSPAVAVALRPRASRFDDGNSGYIASDRGVLVIDAPSDPDVAKAWIDRARSEGRAIKWVLNTHWHADHMQGNALVQAAFPDVEIVGHVSLMDDVPKRAAQAHQDRVTRLGEQIPLARAALHRGQGLSGQELDEAAKEAQMASIAQAEEWLAKNRDSEFTAPTVTFEDLLNIDLGGLVVELHHFRGHTEGDVVAVLPGLGLAFTGDLLDELPFVGHGAPRSWVKALDSLAGLEVTSFVPGHGSPFGKQHLQSIRAFLSSVIETVDAARRDGVSLEETIATHTLPEWRLKLATDDAARAFYDGTIGDALTAAWNELDR